MSWQTARFSELLDTGRQRTALRRLRSRGTGSPSASIADLDTLRSHLHAALNDSNPTKRVKGVLQAMVDGIRVDARDQIEPTFRVPAVRIESGYMELIGAISNQDVQARLLQLSTKLDQVAASNAAPRRSTRPDRILRPGLVLGAVTAVLAVAEEPMRLRDIHAAVVAQLKQPVPAQFVQELPSRQGARVGCSLRAHWPGLLSTERA